MAEHADSLFFSSGPHHYLLRHPPPLISILRRPRLLISLLLILLSNTIHLPKRILCLRSYTQPIIRPRIQHRPVEETAGEPSNPSRTSRIVHTIAIPNGFSIYQMVR